MATLFCHNTTSISSVLLQRERALQSTNVGNDFFALYAMGDRVGGNSLELSGHGSAQTHVNVYFSVEPVSLLLAIGRSGRDNCLNRFTGVIPLSSFNSYSSSFPAPPSSFLSVQSNESWRSLQQSKFV